MFNRMFKKMAANENGLFIVGLAFVVVFFLLFGLPVFISSLGN